ncbi:hypothetical protein AK812_SmicGene12586 [Symbiodinium microadriaticum]|uniref:Uncharacterized protein n=1 Tax=Symbiodinium microadriaticum TaxID=2951 RepID=A0A1Q9EAB8_SYMMI|nr:hypothetical protein AK812_SmicGene12586 [Symbiodinium microadriaticum]CAE7867435.1 unnamed protein product [Symbiodinium microadriaticum]CAE7915315.1 unnamed protein product [Symbiodinium sp. KB8]
MLQVLDQRFQFSAEQELSDWLENLFFRMRRQRGEETTAFTTRFETTISKVEELMTQELRAERRRQSDAARAEFRRASLDHMVAVQTYNALVAQLADGAEQPSAPVAPPQPAELPAVVPFTFPEAMKGFIFLRHVGISLQTRASLLRSSGGSLRYDRVADLLRKTELDALVAARTTSSGGHAGHSYLAEGAHDETEDDDQDWSDEDYEDYAEEFGGYADEDVESEDGGEDDAVDEEPDEELDAAMLGYLEARRKLLAAKKARGFKEPAEGHAGHKETSSGHSSRDGRSRPSFGKGRASSSGHGRDFQWRDRPRASSSSHGRPRQKTPPPRKPKGKGKGKSKSKPGGKRPARREPAGSQYLGMAVSADRGAGLATGTMNFNPEFSFMAFPVDEDDTQDFGYVARTVPLSVERLVDKYLSLDSLMGLDTQRDEGLESCCLVTPPGHAILDTGCTSTLVGSENERLWSEELQRLTGGQLTAEKGPSEVRFEGINGEAKASYKVKYPVRIANQDGFVQASVIPGRAPFLLSIQALRQMKAKLDCSTDTLEIPNIGTVQLKVNQVGHYLLPLFDFNTRHGFVSAEAEDANFGPEGELEDLTRQGGPTVQGSPEGFPPPANVDTPAVYKPLYSSNAHRKDSYARSVLTRLAKDTHGPWVAMPKELQAVYTILGRYGFNKEKEPWQVRAAQIGYRPKVIRRPPPLMKDAYVSVLATSDRSLERVLDWTPCEQSCGKSLQCSSDKDSQLQKCLPPPGLEGWFEVGPPTEEPPQYAHTARHNMERYSNGGFTTYHCGQCRPCRICKGKILQVAHSSGKVMYTPLKDCGMTTMPAPPGLQDGDLVRDASAASFILDGKAVDGTDQRIPYPLDVRKVEIGKVEQKPLKGKTSVEGALSGSVSTPEVKPPARMATPINIKGVINAPAASTPSQSMPKVFQPTARDLTRESIKEIVKETLQQELESGGGNPDADVPMLAVLTPELAREIRTLEGKASEMWARAAQLKKSVGLPINQRLSAAPAPPAPSPTPSASSAAMPPVFNPSAGPAFDPDGGDGWELAQLL